jgi:hypothetical protein
MFGKAMVNVVYGMSASAKVQAVLNMLRALRVK